MDSEKYGYYYYTKGSLWWKKEYKCDVYIDNAKYNTIFHGSNAVSTGFEYKGNKNAPITISQTRKFSIGSQTVATLWKPIEFKYCVADCSLTLILSIFFK